MPRTDDNARNPFRGLGTISTASQQLERVLRRAIRERGSETLQWQMNHRDRNRRNKP